MKWVCFESKGVARFGILEEGLIIETSLTWQDILEGRSPDSGAHFRPGEVKLLAPVSRPGKIVAIGLNYMDHCREQKVDPPAKPVIFAKFATAVIGPGAAIKWSGALTQQVDYEAELAVIIGRTARSVTQTAALDYVLGYTAANDVSARDLQFEDRQWVRGKSLDTFCPLGPALITSDEIPSPQELAIRCELNGERVQDSNTREMIFGVAQLISFCSQAFTLEPGDVILTGTPHGVGMSREPNLFLKDGDRVTVEIEKVGRLENPCIVEQGEVR